MAVIGLNAFLAKEREGTTPFWQVPGGFYSPGFWVALAALARNERISFDRIIFSNPEKHLGYAQAIGLPVALGEADQYRFVRRNDGQNYSPLVLLEDASLTDRATSDVNGCIRHLCDGLGVDRFTSELCEVVGDLHDNVWSHGKSTGFSMAQRWHEHNHRDTIHFEFALADCGLGFLREMKRVGLTPSDDREAIEWCIQRGHSSKLHAANNKPQDDWAQWLPPDMVGNPLPGIGKAQDSDNHHQGLGLAKLISLVENYGGELCLTTGNSTLKVDSNGRHTFSMPRVAWPGVALSCRFNTTRIKQTSQERDTTDSVMNDLMKLLGGGHE